MYSNLPRIERLAMRGTLASGWALTAASGFGGALFTGKTVIAASDPSWLIYMFSWITAVAALIAVVGVVAGGRLWWLEWVGSGLAGAGVSYYAIAPWMYFIQGELGRAQQGFIIAAFLVGFVVHRMAACWSHARKLARRHELEEALGYRGSE